MVSKYTRSQKSRRKTEPNPRSKLLLASFYLGFLAILGRLFYWQIIEGSLLTAKAQEQYDQTLIKHGQRGRIFTQGGHLLVGNTTRYRLVGYPHLITQSPAEISQALIEPLLPELRPYQQATESARQATIKANFELELENKLSQEESRWVSLLRQISVETKQKILELEIEGLDFEPTSTRFYPEASMAAHVTGFVGQDEAGQTVGYFGLEGGLDQELSGQTQTTTLPSDMLGFSLFKNDSQALQQVKGRDIVTTLRRDLQYLAETHLKKTLSWTGAKAGEIIIMDPDTGQIMALATQPQYDQAYFHEYAAELYKNPALTNIFEPGSILKPLTVAAGIDAGAVTPDTKCPNCDGPRVIDKYTIRTWNDQYHPQITVKEALAKSDNVAMIHVAEELGIEKFKQYLQNFGFGDSTELELHEDQTTSFPEKWGPVELATRSFGQGITVTSLQMIRAMGAIANQGLMMQPQIVKQVIKANGQKIPVEPEAIRQVISPQTAATTTELMVYAAKEGEAQWTYSKDHSVAGKTGTSQIPDEKKGGYKEEATITSYIGFAPPQSPKFVMLVKLIEPQSSPWAAETAAPAWYQLANKLFLSLKIPADRN